MSPVRNAERSPGSARRALALVLILASALCYGCMPSLSRPLYEAGMRPLLLSFHRFLFSLPFLYLLQAWNRRRAARGQGALAPAGEEEGQSLLPGQFQPVPGALASLRSHWSSWSGPARRSFCLIVLGYALTPVLLFASYQYLDGGMATVLHFFYPALVLLLHRFFTGTRCSRTQLLALAASSLGVFASALPLGTLRPSGMVLALFSALTFALYIVLLDAQRGFAMGVFLLSFWISAFSALLVGLLCLALGQFQIALPPLLYLGSLAFSLLTSVLGLLCFQLGLAVLGGSLAALLSCFEPLTAVILGVCIAGESLPLSHVLGIALILAALLLLCLAARKRNLKPEEARQASFKN